MVGLQRSTYYDIKHHQPTNQEIRRVLLAHAIADIHARSRGTYGMLRVRAALEIERGIIVNKKLVWKIMRQLGIRGLPGPKKWKPNLVNAATEEDLVKRNFMATGPNELWLTDITEHPTREGKVYCCAVLDLFSRKIVGWAIDRRCESSWSTTHWSWRPSPGQPHGKRSSTPTMALSSRPGPSPRTSVATDSWGRWARSGIVTTMPRWNRSGGRCRSSC